MKLINSLLLLLILTACSSPISEFSYKNATIIAPEKPAPLNLRDVNFTVITNSTTDKFKNSEVWYALTAQDYENLSKNIQDVLRYLKDQNSIIAYYEEVNQNNVAEN